MTPMVVSGTWLGDADLTSELMVIFRDVKL